MDGRGWRRTRRPTRRTRQVRGGLRRGDRPTAVRRAVALWLLLLRLLWLLWLLVGWRVERIELRAIRDWLREGVCVGVRARLVRLA